MILDISYKIRSNFLKYSFLWFSILVSFIFIYLPFFDNNNLSAWVNLPSTLTNTLPAFSSSPWPGGPFFLSIFVPMGYFYIFTGYSLYRTAILLKLILFTFTFLSGYISYKIVEKINPKYSRFVFLFLVLNPATIFVDYVWAQLDIIPVFLTLLSFYALYYTNIDEKKFTTQIVLMIPIFFAIFIYYYPIILLPSFIIYTKNIKISFLRLINFIILGASFFSIDIFLFGGFKFSTLNSLEPSVSSKYFQGLQSMVILSEPTFILILILTSILVPIISRKLGFSVFMPVYIALLTLLYISNSALPDNFLWILPFSILLILDLEKLKLKKSLILCSNIFLFTGILFINFYIGTGTQAGIFYFGYRVFHINYLFITSLSDFHFYVLIYFIFLTFSFIFSLFLAVFLSWRNRKAMRKNNIVIKNQEYFPAQKFGNVDEAGVTTMGKTHFRLKRIVIILFVLLILVAGSLIFNSTAFREIDYNDSQTVPIYYFAPSYSNGIFAMPINNLTYQLENHSIYFFKDASSVYLSRDLTRESINLSMNERFTGNCIENVSLMKTNLFNINIYKSLEINNSNQAGIYPLNELNITSNNVFINNLTSSIQVYNVSLENLFTYKFSNITEQRSIFYNIPNTVPPSATFNQTVPFGLKLGNFTFNIVLYKNSGLLVFHNNSKSCFVKPFVYHPISNNWNIFSYNVSKRKFNLMFDEFNYSFPMLANNNFSYEKVYIGEQPGLGETHSFAGKVSIMYNSSGFKYIKGFKILIASSNFRKTLNASEHGIHINVNDNLIKTTLKVNNNTVNFNKTLTYLLFGKLDNYRFGLNINILQLNIQNIGSNSYYLVPVYFAFILPYLIPFCVVIYLRKH